MSAAPQPAAELQPPKSQEQACSAAAALQPSADAHSRPQAGSSSSSGRVARHSGRPLADGASTPERAPTALAARISCALGATARRKTATPSTTETGTRPQSFVQRQRRATAAMAMATRTAGSSRHRAKQSLRSAKPAQRPRQPRAKASARSRHRAAPAAPRGKRCARDKRTLRAQPQAGTDSQRQGRQQKRVRLYRAAKAENEEARMSAEADRTTLLPSRAAR